MSVESVGTNVPYQVVARRYRPLGFDKLVGQGHISQALTNAIQTHRIGHAYLFTGARGVGKTSTARIFAKALNCEQGPTPNPCNVCDACIGINSGEDVDVLEIDGASNRGIDEIRQLRQNVSIRPSRSKYKIYIIDEVHMLTREAFNALLKTLEEPPEHVKFIFCTTEATKIPITILSRCQRFDFAGIDSASIAQRLSEIAKNEGVTADEGVFETLARRAAGSMRDGQSLLEQLLSFAPKHIAIADIHGMLGTADDQRLIRLIDTMRGGAMLTIFTELDAAANEGVDVGVLIEQLMGLFRDLMVVASGGDVKLMHYSDPGRFEQIREIADSLGLPRILASLQILDQTHNRMRYSTQSRTLLEMALVRLASLDELQQIANLIEQIKTGGNLSISNPQPIKVPQRTISAPEPPVQKAVPVHEKPTRIEDFPEKKKMTPEPPPSVEPEKKAPVSIEPSEAFTYWKLATAQLGKMLAMHAENVDYVRFAVPDRFIIGLKSGLSKTFCEQDSSKIHAALESVLSQPIRITFELSENADKPNVNPAAKIPSPQMNKGKVLREISENPFVQKAEEIFNASLKDVK